MFRRFARYIDPRDPHGIRWSHYTITLVFAVLLGISFGVAATKTVEYVQMRQGTGLTTRPHLTAPIIRAAGAAPVSASVKRWVLLVHDQGSSFTCVAQTETAMIEIWQKEIGHPVRMSPGWIFDALAGPYATGLSYQDGFTRVKNYGDATWNEDPTNGQDGYGVPNSPDAYRYRFANWYQIALTDHHTILYELAHGRPVAIAMPWHAGLAFHDNDSSPVTADYGAFQWWHSTTIVSANGWGVELLNSFGRGYGNSGFVWVSWNVIENDTDPTGYVGAAVVAIPAAKRPAPPKFPIKKWNAFRSAAHVSLISPYTGHALRWEARAWWSYGPKRAGGIVSVPQWFPRGKRGRDGFMTVRFQHRRYYFWPNHRGWQRWQVVRTLSPHTWHGKSVRRGRH